MYRNKLFVFWLISVFLFALNAPGFAMGKKTKYGETTVLCPQGDQNPAGTAYCITCGLQIEPAKSSFCPEGHQNKLGAQFCQECGQKITPPVIKETADYSVCELGHKNARDAKFCQECGKAVTLPQAGKNVNHCPEGHLNPPEAHYCLKCGKKIASAIPRREERYKAPRHEVDRTKDRGKWPAIANIGFFVLLGVGLIVATQSAETYD